MRVTPHHRSSGPFLLFCWGRFSFATVGVERVAHEPIFRCARRLLKPICSSVCVFVFAFALAQPGRSVAPRIVMQNKKKRETPQNKNQKTCTPANVPGCHHPPRNYFAVRSCVLILFQTPASLGQVVTTDTQPSQSARSTLLAAILCAPNVFKVNAPGVGNELAHDRF